MRLLSIRLNNVRRFTSPVVVSGMGPGLNVLCAPNESGKSTVFEALNAVFFKRANSWDKDMRGLVPHAGGDPEVEVEFEAGGVQLRLAKTWSSAAGRRSVRMWQDDRLVAQSDAAEARIAELVQAPKQGGPAGLLWVRQGLTALEADQTGRETRRGLLSSVAGEVEAMTGGRRMEAALAAVTEDLDRYLTARGKVKAGGPLAEAEQEVAALQARHDDLSATLRALREAIDRRSALQRELAGIEDPQAQAERRDRLAEAREAHSRAERHAERLTSAMAAERAAETAAQSAESALARLDALIAERGQAEAALIEAKETARIAATEAAETRRSREEVAAAHADALAASRQADAALSRLERAEAARSSAALRTELQARLARGERLSADIARLRAAAGQGPDAAVLSALEALWDKLRLETRAAEAQAPRLLARYDAQARGPIAWPGGTLADGEATQIRPGTVLTLPGLGTLEVAAGGGGAEDALDNLRRRLDRALTDAGCTSLDAARDAAAARDQAERRLAEARRGFDIDFPDGLDPIRARIATLPDAAPEEDAPTDRDAAEAAATTARQALAAAEGRLQAAREQAERSGRAEQAATLACDAARDRCAQVQARLAVELDGTTDATTAREALLTRCAESTEALRTATAARAALERDAPDLDQAKARLTRLREAQAGADQRRLELRADIARLDGQIAASAGAAPEEEATDAEARLATARKRLQAIRFEVAVLTRLRNALDAARNQARDRYIAPVMAELAPLLEMLLPGTELALDADSLLPEGLIRDGRTETEESLSGGTREQIALLVRLAFARLLARAGQPAPVLLDDAIVFTDDDRIERLFDALTRQAEELQILVFSCRQKAFRDLGGRQLRLVPDDSAQEPVDD